MSELTKPKRTYKRISKELAARFEAERSLQGSGTRAVQVLEPDHKWPRDRAVSISAHLGNLSADEYLDKSIEQIATVAIDRVADIVNSKDEQVALKASQFVIEQRRGKAVQKSQSQSVTLNIQAVLE